jgi:type I restriction enzyme M protein
MKDSEFLEITGAAAKIVHDASDPVVASRYGIALLFLRSAACYATEPHAQSIGLHYRGTARRLWIPNGASFEEIFEYRDSPNIDERIDNALFSVQAANSDRLSGVFDALGAGNESRQRTDSSWPRTLRSLTEFLHRLPLPRPEHEAPATLYAALNGFLPNMLRDLRYLAPPREVTELVALLADPVVGQSVYDPASGIGTLLIRTAEKSGIERASLYGEESIRAVWSIAVLNAYMHRATNVEIVHGDSLRAPAFVESNRLKCFDVVVSHPPSGKSAWGVELAEHDRFSRYRRGIPPRSNGDWAFLTHMIESAKDDTGRIVAIVPQGVLFRGGPEAALRRSIIHENIVDAVIKLPPKLFVHTAISFTVLLLDKGRPSRGASHVTLIDASESDEYSRLGNRLSNDRVDDIVSLYHELRGRAEVELRHGDLHAKNVASDELASSNFSLNLSTYLQPRSAVENPNELRTRIADLERELATVRQELVDHSDLLGT